MRKAKFIGVIGFIILLSIVISDIVRVYDGKLQIVFCDVGQGDAILIRTPGRYEILVDGGPNSRVLDCLDEELPFWDRKLTAIFLTHPHYDHFRGLIDVLDRYSVGFVGQEDLLNESDAYQIFADSVDNENTQTQIVEKGMSLRFEDGVRITVLGPDAAYLSTENPDGVTAHDNPPSLILHLSYGHFDLILPGDSDAEDVEEFIGRIVTPEVLALPHHGSENGYTPELARILVPKVGVISAGVDNSYGHPHTSVIDLLTQNDSQIFRTDLHGRIRITVDRAGNYTIRTKRTVTQI